MTVMTLWYCVTVMMCDDDGGDVMVLCDDDSDGVMILCDDDGDDVMVLCDDDDDDVMVLCGGDGDGGDRIGHCSAQLGPQHNETGHG